MAPILFHVLRLLPLELRPLLRVSLPAILAAILLVIDHSKKPLPALRATAKANPMNLSGIPREVYDSPVFSCLFMVLRVKTVANLQISWPLHRWHDRGMPFVPRQTGIQFFQNFGSFRMMRVAFGSGRESDGLAELLDPVIRFNDQCQMLRNDAGSHIQEPYNIGFLFRLFGPFSFAALDDLRHTGHLRLS